VVREKGLLHESSLCNENLQKSYVSRSLSSLESCSVHLFNSIVYRSAKRSIFFIGFFSNSMYNYAFTFCVVGQCLVVYAPFFQDIFQTEALGLKDLIVLVVLASSVLWVDEVRKWRENGMASGGVVRRLLMRIGIFNCGSTFLSIW
jgi:hypothetical protein